MRELKATDKITQKMTRDGAVSENLATGEVKHIPTYKALRKSKNAHKIRKTEDVQTPSVSSFGFSIFKAPSMAPSTIGKYCSGQSFNFGYPTVRLPMWSMKSGCMLWMGLDRPR